MTPPFTSSIVNSLSTPENRVVSNSHPLQNPYLEIFFHYHQLQSLSNISHQVKNSISAHRLALGSQLCRGQLCRWPRRDEWLGKPNAGLYTRQCPATHLRILTLFYCANIEFRAVELSLSQKQQIFRAMIPYTFNTDLQNMKHQNYWHEILSQQDKESVFNDHL